MNQTTRSRKNNLLILTRRSSVFKASVRAITGMIIVLFMTGGGPVFAEWHFDRMWPEISTKGWYLNEPNDVAPGSDGFVYVADTKNFRIQKYTTGGRFVASFGRRGVGHGEFVNPTDIAFHPDGFLYVSDVGSDENGNSACRIQKLTCGGEWVADIGEWGYVGDWGDDG